MLKSDDLTSLVHSQFARRNQISSDYIPRHSDGLARICREMAERLRTGGRLLAVGVGAYRTDAQHISVEVVHPVIVGKRALPALDLSIEPPRMLEALARPRDIVMAFAGPEGDDELTKVMRLMSERGALACLWPGRLGDYGLPAASSDPFIHQELTEVPAISLSMEPANLNAIANDVGAELMFQRQLIANGGPRDIAVAISTSGKSKNPAAALGEARKRGMLTIGLAGYDGGDFVREKLVDYALVVRSDYIPRIQEVQATIYHVFRLAFDDAAA